MSAVEEILAQVPVDDIAAELGVPADQVEAATRAALPTLLGGLAANAEDAAGAASISEALGQHAPLTGPVSLSAVDAADGDRIVGHVFGANTDQVVDQLAGTSQFAGLDSALGKKLLAILAPIVLSYLAGKVAGGSGGTLGTILESVLKGQLGGGATASTESKSGGIGDILGDVLGGLLGAGRR